MSVPPGLLKHIPCPKGKECTSRRCLFRHEGDDKQWPMPATTTASTSTLPSSAAPTPVPVQPHPSVTPARSVSECNGQNGVSVLGTETGAPAGRKHRSYSADEGVNSSPAPRKRAKTARDRSGEDDRATPHTSSLESTSSALKQMQLDKPTHSTSQQHHQPPTPPAPSISSLHRPISPPPLRNERNSQAAGNAPAPGTRPSAVVIPAPAQRASSTMHVKPRPPETLNPRHVLKAPAKHEIRLRLLKLLHKSFARLNSELQKKGTAEDNVSFLRTDQELITMALDMEESYAVSKSASIYSDSIKHRVVAYMHMTVDQWKTERAEESAKQLQKEKDGTGATATPSKPKLPPVSLDTGLPPALEVALVKRFLLTPIDKLSRHGYVPRVPSAADIQKARDAEAVSKGWEQCDFCKTRFQVFPGRREEDGALVSGGQCKYHPGRVNQAQKAYRCCGESIGDRPSLGCTVAAHHRYKVSDAKRLALLWNFVDTPTNPLAPTDRAVCFDCEMAYTVHGMEVVRLTATEWPSGHLLLDVLVRTLGEILDLNSQYSGVWPDDMVNALPYTGEAAQDPASPGTRSLRIVPSPQAARDLFFALISPETPLIGHALENDLNIMRIVHPTLVDTVLLFPHPRPLPVRYGLKMLVEEYLHRTIQEIPAHADKQGGHDSAEDARAAGDLVRFKVKKTWEEQMRQGRKVVDGQFEPVL